MELKQLTVFDFAEVLSSDAPAPGGGSAAALTGALGAALTAMVCALTLDRKKYAAHQALAQQTLAQARELQRLLLEKMDEDTRAFGQMRAAFALPKETPEQSSARTAAIQQALSVCTETPLSVMALALQALELACGAMGKTNASAISDLGVAALSLRAALQGAWLNVLINTGSMKDAVLAADCRARGEALLERGLPLAEGLYQSVLSAL